MVKAERVRDLVHEETRETTKGEARRRGHRNDDDVALVSDVDADLGTPSGANGRGHHDDVATLPNAHGRKPPGEKRPEVFGGVA